ncbi:OmpA family protein [Sphingomonas sp.]|uniref:OmpA family protein n=1 Tax=Sphingomonas sp. TaxID=28214 RepID=UPI0035BC3393
MRPIVIVLAGIGVSFSGAALAQTAKNTPEGIICAMTGSCDTQAAAGDRVKVGDEKAFSLARAAPAANAAPPARAAAAPMPRPRARTMASTRTTTSRFALAPAPKVRPGGGLDMLVTFQRGSATMTPQAQAEARAFAQAMSAPQMAGMRFAIEGHTDATGTHDKNMTLSQARAQSVVDYLVTQGVDSSRLSAKGYGPDRPIRGTRATAPANRRVEFVKQA